MEYDHIIFHNAGKEKNFPRQATEKWPKPARILALRPFSIINPKNIIPIHYNSNPIAKGTLAEFQAAMKGSSIKVTPMTEEQTIEFYGLCIIRAQTISASRQILGAVSA